MHESNLALMKTLGVRTGELHRALAVRTGDPDFDPEPVSADDLAQWGRNLAADVERTLDALQHFQQVMPERARAQAERLLAQRAVLQERVRATLPGEVQAVKARYHGDYHLGQVLLVQDDFIIIDFEGEPARPLAERRRKHSPLRDVAGMLRSFQYAAYAAMFHLTADREEDLPRVAPLAREWELRAGHAFLEGYVDGVGDSPCYPQEPGQARALIELFMLEKALYELRYEIDSRPDWAVVPVTGLLELLGAAAAEDAQG